MSYNNIEVTRNRPCPVCGKPDYCSFYYPNSETELLICKRTETESDVMGRDGQIWHFISRSRNDFLVFEELNRHEARKAKEKDEWMRANNVGPYNPNRKGEYKPNSVPYSAPQVATPAYREIEIVDAAEPRDHIQLDRFYRTLLSLLVLDDVHREYLMSEGWTDELISSSMAKSFPEKDFTRFKYNTSYSKNLYRKNLCIKLMELLGEDNLEGYPPCFVDKSGNWTMCGPKGIVFPIYDVDGYIYSLRVRMDFLDVPLELIRNPGQPPCYQDYKGIWHWLYPFKGFCHADENNQPVWDKGYYSEKRFVEQKGKYRPLTSFYADKEEASKGRQVNIYKRGSKAENGISFYGNDGCNTMVAYITEGEKKGIFASDVMNALFITVPGVEAWGDLLKGEIGVRPIDKLKKKGCKMIILMYDADKNHNKMVLRAQFKVAEALKNEGFMIGVGEWDESLGKGLDDLLSNGEVPGYDILPISSR